jgi:predicted amidophosphoribosyltransferase
VELDHAGRAAAAASAFRVRAWPPAGPVDPDVAVVVLDDILTTGATLSAVARTLRAAGLPPAVAAVLAATRRRRTR